MVWSFVYLLALSASLEHLMWLASWAKSWILFLFKYLIDSKGKCMYKNVGIVSYMYRWFHHIWYSWILLKNPSFSLESFSSCLNISHYLVLSTPFPGQPRIWCTSSEWAINNVCLAVVGLLLSKNRNWSLVTKSSALFPLSYLLAPSMATGVVWKPLNAHVSPAFSNLSGWALRIWVLCS